MMAFISKQMKLVGPCQLVSSSSVSMVLKQIDISSLLGYTVAAVMFLSGVVVLSGLLVNPNVPMKFRVTFGVVLLLMGIYRFVMTRTRIKQMRQDEVDR